jgi:hypothetical protein
MHIQARRVFRLSATMALALAAGYALQLPLPFIPPLFALLFTSAPQPPMGLKALLVLLVVLMLTLGIGLLLIPILTYYALTAILIVALGLYLSFYMSVNLGKAMLGTLLTVGFTLISAAGTVASALSVLVIEAIALGVVLAIICQWLVYPWFPEDVTVTPGAEEKSLPEQSNWIALRATFIVLPAYLLLLSNPAAYMPVMMKTIMLAQQASMMNARSAGRELLGSTFLGGVFSVLIWVLLGILPSLWMFFFWMLLFGIYFASKFYQLIPSRLPPSFWLNVVITCLIILGPAVEDSANGKDVYAAFLVRMGLFIAVTLYTWLAVYLLEAFRTYRSKRKSAVTPELESSPC